MAVLVSPPFAFVTINSEVFTPMVNRSHGHGLLQIIELSFTEHSQVQQIKS